MSGFGPASAIARAVDRLMWAELAICGFFGALIFGLILLCVARYRGAERAGPMPHGAAALAIELTWIGIPLLIALGMFSWGALLFYRIRQPPPESIEIAVVGKQWMWKLQHPDGKRELNELHVPRGRPVKLVMTSQDVIHSFYVPAFRVKQDVLPGRYTTLWFEPDRLGAFPIYCAEYCGTYHSGMIGRVFVVAQAEYQRWLGGESAAGEERAAAPGRVVFERLGCGACHLQGTGQRAPELAGLFGTRVRLRGGRSATADAAYLRESILDPGAKVVDGYPPIMPSFRGRIAERELKDLLDYLKSLKAGGA